MTSHDAEKEWQKYLTHFFTGIASPLLRDDATGLPYIFAHPCCATCVHWHLVHRDGLSWIQNPDELEEIERGIAGKALRTADLGAGQVDVYQTHAFYGWCKRFPPSRPGQNRSIVGFRSLLTLFIGRGSKSIADYEFPLVSETNRCGEWSKAAWVDRYVQEKMAAKSET